MDLVQLPEYIKAAEDFVSLNPLGYARMAYIMSDDQKVIDEAKRLSFIGSDITTPSQDWIFYSSNIQRFSTPKEQIDSGKNRTVTTLNNLMEIMIVNDRVYILPMALTSSVVIDLGERSLDWYAWQQL